MFVLTFQKLAEYDKLLWKKFFLQMENDDNTTTP
jgi:hypothetical protein